MFKLIVKLAIVAAIAHAGFRIVPVFWQYANFKDRLAETARFAGKKDSPDILAARSMKIATELEVPLEQPIKVQRTPELTIIDVRYTSQLEYFPKQFYPWDFVIHVEEEQRYGGYMP
jgi:hypothetical protein